MLGGMRKSRTSSRYRGLNGNVINFSLSRRPPWDIHRWSTNQCTLLDPVVAFRGVKRHDDASIGRFKTLA